MSWGEQSAKSCAQPWSGSYCWRALIRTKRSFPVLSFLGIASILGWCATMLWQRETFVQAFHWLTIVPFFMDGSTLRFVSYEVMLGTGQIWRLVTPAFLHFSFLHLAFNLAIAVELGRRTEAVLGSRHFAALSFVVVVVSNQVQFLIDPTPLFGGLSGLNYGLVGFVVLRRVRNPYEHRWQVAPTLMAFLLICMVLFSIGVGEGIGLHAANGAHWGGLLSGLLLGWALPRGNRQV